MIRCASCFVALAGCVSAASAESPRSTPIQPELFAAHEALANAFADNDGDLDLFVTAYVDGENSYSRSHLFMNQHGRFIDALGEGSPLQAADHGVQWADFDGDGDLGMSLTDTFPENGRHPLFRNELAKDVVGRSLQVLVVDRSDLVTRTGSEVRLYAADGELLGTRLIPTGDGYGTQSVVPVHFGLTEMGK